MSHDEYIAHARRYLATQYCHHKRMMRECAGRGGEDWHRLYMTDARKRMLGLKGASA